jgi:hypothetical protein
MAASAFSLPSPFFFSWKPPTLRGLRLPPGLVIGRFYLSGCNRVGKGAVNNLPAYMPHPHYSSAPPCRGSMKLLGLGAKVCLAHDAAISDRRATSSSPAPLAFLALTRRLLRTRNSFAIFYLLFFFYFLRCPGCPPASASCFPSRKLLRSTGRRRAAGGRRRLRQSCRPFTKPAQGSAAARPNNI